MFETSDHTDIIFFFTFNFAYISYIISPISSTKFWILINELLSSMDFGSSIAIVAGRIWARCIILVFFLFYMLVFNWFWSISCWIIKHLCLACGVVFLIMLYFRFCLKLLLDICASEPWKILLVSLKTVSYCKTFVMF